MRLFGLFRESVAPFLGILGAMEYGINYNLVRIVLKEYGVRKTSNKRTTIIFMNDRIYARMSFDREDYDFQAPDKIHAKS